MESIRQQFTVPFRYDVHFTHGVFASDNPRLAEVLGGAPGNGVLKPARALFVLDGGLVAATPELPAALRSYAAAHASRVTLVAEPLVLPGGEVVKSDPRYLHQLQEALYTHGLCRHSFLVAVGGGALLDLAGFAAATMHRGVRLVRLPSTVLAQDDAGIGVKNGINAFGKKNLLGAFAPPWAVINDFDLLRTLSPRDQRSGMAEAVKVALIRDRAFFEELEGQRDRLVRGEAEPLERLIRQCAALHLHHIREGGDPFELGSARPLDFGHWSAHRLEELTSGELRHGEAVAIGMALDAWYAADTGLLTHGARRRILALLTGLGFALYHPALTELAFPAALRSFQEHLGGELTITLPDRIGHGIEVHEIDLPRLERCRELLRQWAAQGERHGTEELPADRARGVDGVLPGKPGATHRDRGLSGSAHPGSGPG